MTTDSLPEIEDIKRLVLGPDDVLVVRVKSRIDVADAAMIRDRVRANLPTARVLILGDGASLDVLTAEQIDSLPSG